jgi:hypothetical protein
MIDIINSWLLVRENEEILETEGSGYNIVANALHDLND